VHGRNSDGFRAPDEGNWRPRRFGNSAFLISAGAVILIGGFLSEPWE
jgi:hypothetical protein